MMNNSEIIKKYDQICASLDKDNSETNKQQYLIIFKELDIQLNKSFQTKMEQLSYSAKSLKEEIRRVDTILKIISNRIKARNKMISDHHKYIGYDPLELEGIDGIERENDYKLYLSNLEKSNAIITELIRCGKKLKTLKIQLEKSAKRQPSIEEEISKIQKYRASKMNELKSDAEALEDLYNYCLTAPFNEENAYIEYILIKLNPGGELKINLEKEDNKRTLKNRSNMSRDKVQETMPEINKVGAVRPNNMLTRLENATKEFDSIDIPTNGLINNKEQIKIDMNKIS